MKCCLRVHRIDRDAVGKSTLLPRSGVGEEMAPARSEDGAFWPRRVWGAVGGVPLIVPRTDRP
jgi:hypothetical protein